MAYTENKSIDWLTAITPTTDDLVVTMDQTEVWVAKSSTLLSIYNLFKTTYDTVYAKYLGDADFYKYSITTSESGGNLTVALKNYEGNDPTPTKPVKIQIGGVIRTITSACYINATIAWTNWWNAWSTELATKEIDWFVYILDYNNSGTVFNMWISRYPLYNNLSEATWWYTWEKYLIQAWNIWIENVVNIGRFNATLSAGGAYTWSIPATSVIINSPIYETRWLDWVTSLSWSTGTIWAYTESNKTCKYKIEWDKMTMIFGLKVTNVWSWTGDSRIKTMMAGTVSSDTILGSWWLMNWNNGTFSHCFSAYAGDLNLANNFWVNWWQYSDITVNDWIMGNVTYPI